MLSSKEAAHLLRLSYAKYLLDVNFAVFYSYLLRCAYIISSASSKRLEQELCCLLLDLLVLAVKQACHHFLGFVDNRFSSVFHVLLEIWLLV